MTRVHHYGFIQTSFTAQKARAPLIYPALLPALKLLITYRLHSFASPKTSCRWNPTVGSLSTLSNMHFRFFRVFLWFDSPFLITGEISLIIVMDVPEFIFPFTY